MSHLLHVFLWIRGYQPAPMGLVRDRFRLFLHLPWIVNIHFFISWQCQCSPDTRIRHLTFLVGIERDFHLDGALNRRWIAARGLRALFQGWQQLIAIQFVALAGCADEAI